MTASVGLKTLIQQQGDQMRELVQLEQRVDKDRTKAVQNLERHIRKHHISKDDFWLPRNGSGLSCLPLDKTRKLRAILQGVKDLAAQRQRLVEQGKYISSRMAQGHKKP